MLLNTGQNNSSQNFITEELFYDLWRAQAFTVRATPSKASNSPNISHIDKKTNLQINSWPVHGYTYDVLVGSLYLELNLNKLEYVCRS